jgi:uncharacterized membrane protein
LTAALLGAAVLGVAAVAVVAIAPEALAATLFGARYASVGALAVPYVLAMALLGVVRVLVAARCATGAARPTVAWLAIAALGHAALVLVMGEDARGGALATLATMTVLAAGAAGAGVVRLPFVRRRLDTGVGAPDAGRELGTGSATPAATPLERLVASVRRTPGVAAIVTAATVVGFALRLAVTRSLWLDEATSVAQVQLPFAAMLADLRATDVHPPLHHALLWVTVRVLGTGELAVRLPSIVLGTLLIPVLYLLGRELWDRRTGTIAAALGAVAPLAVWYSQEARMYALMALCAALALLGQVRALRHGRPRDWTLYALATTAMLWTQYFAILPVAVQQAAFALIAWRRRRAGHAGDPPSEPAPGRASARATPDARPGRLVAGWAAATAAVAALTAPLLPFLLDQLVAYSVRGAGLQRLAQAGADVVDQPGVYALITNFVWGLWGYHAGETMAAIVALWPLLMLATLALLGRGRSEWSVLLLALVLVPAFSLFAVGFFKRDLFELRYFIGAVPAMLLLVSRGVSSWSRHRAVPVVATVLLLASFGVALADQQLNGLNPRLYDFRGALAEISARAEPGDVLLYEPGYLNYVIAYYAPDLPAEPIERGLDPGDGARTVFVLGSFLDNPSHAGRTGSALAELDEDREVVDAFSAPNVRVWVLR